MSKKEQLKVINCSHYKGDGYTYIFNKNQLNLCENCEMELLGEMKKQEVIENKMQKEVNVLLQKDIDRISKENKKQ